MNMTADKIERQNQREILKKEFKHYIPIHHDVFVMEYNRKKEKEKLENYMKERKII